MKKSTKYDHDITNSIYFTSLCCPCLYTGDITSIFAREKKKNSLCLLSSLGPLGRQECCYTSCLFLCGGCCSPCLISHINDISWRMEAIHGDPSEEGFRLSSVANSYRKRVNNKIKKKSFLCFTPYNSLKNCFNWPYQLSTQVLRTRELEKEALLSFLWDLRSAKDTIRSIKKIEVKRNLLISIGSFSFFHAEFMRKLMQMTLPIGDIFQLPPPLEQSSYPRTFIRAVKDDYNHESEYSYDNNRKKDMIEYWDIPVDRWNDEMIKNKYNLLLSEWNLMRYDKIENDVITKKYQGKLENKKELVKYEMKHDCLKDKLVLLYILDPTSMQHTKKIQELYLQHIKEGQEELDMEKYSQGNYNASFKNNNTEDLLEKHKEDNIDESNIDTSDSEDYFNEAPSIPPPKPIRAVVLLCPHYMDNKKLWSSHSEEELDYAVDSLSEWMKSNCKHWFEIIVSSTEHYNILNHHLIQLFKGEV